MNCLQQVHHNIALDRLICRVNEDILSNLLCEIKHVNKSLYTYTFESTVAPNATIHQLYVNQNIWSLLHLVFVRFSEDRNSPLFFTAVICSYNFDWLMQAKLTIAKREGETYRTYMGMNNITLDICRTFDGSLQSIFMDFFLNDFKRYSNFYHPCPFKVRTDIFFCCIKLIDSDWNNHSGSIIHARLYYRR